MRVQESLVKEEDKLIDSTNLSPAPWTVDGDGTIRDANDTAVAHIQHHANANTIARTGETFSRADANFVCLARTHFGKIYALLREAIDLVEAGTLTTAPDWPECSGDNAETVSAWKANAKKVIEDMNR